MTICLLLKHVEKCFRNLFNREMFCVENTQILCPTCWLTKKFTSAINSRSKGISQVQDKSHSIDL